MAISLITRAAAVGCCVVLLMCDAPAVSAQTQPLHLSNAVSVLGNYNHGTTNNYTTTLSDNFMLMNDMIQYSVYGFFKYREDTYIVKSRELAGLFDVDLYPTGTWSPYVLSNAEESYERAIALRVQAGAGLKWAFWKDSLGNAESISAALLFDQSEYTSQKGGQNYSTRRYSLRLKGLQGILNSGFRFQYQFFFQPNIQRVHDYRLRLITSVDLPLTGGLSFRVAASHVYENEPAPGTASSTTSLDYGLSYVIK